MKRSVSRKIFWVLSLYLMVLVLTAASPSEAKELKLLASWPQNMIFVEGCLTPLAANLKAFSKDSLSFKFFGPDVVPTLEQFQPVQSGVFDILCTIPDYHMGTTAVGAAIGAVEADPARRRESGVFDYIDKEYNKLGLKLIAMVPIAKMNVLTRESIAGRQPSFKGLKIRTSHTVIPLVEQLGGTPVNLPAGEVYTALQKGVIDGTVVITFGIIDLKWHEVNKFIIRPAFGYANVCFLMNLEKFKGLTAQEREALEKACQKTELDAMKFFQDKTAAEEKKLQELGLKIEQMRPEDAQKAESIFNQTVWSLAEKKSGDSITKLRDLALSKGLTK